LNPIHSVSGDQNVCFFGESDVLLFFVDTPLPLFLTLVIVSSKGNYSRSSNADGQDWQQMEPRGETPPKKRRNGGNNMQQQQQQQQTPMFPQATNYDSNASTASTNRQTLSAMQLLPGWSAAVDEKSGKTYYFNIDTGERTWDWRKVVSQAPFQHAMYTSRRSDRPSGGESSGSGNKQQPKRPGKKLKEGDDSPRVRRGRVSGGGR